MFRHAQTGPFFQMEPSLGNPYAGDGFLQRLLHRLLPAEVDMDILIEITTYLANTYVLCTSDILRSSFRSSTTGKKN